MGAATRYDIILAARKWLATPYQHQARVIGAGVDCAGLVVGVAHDLALSMFDFTNYGRSPLGSTLLKIMSEEATLISAETPFKNGQIALMRFDVLPQHLGIIAVDGDRTTLIHAYGNAGQVVEHRFANVWQSRLVARFDFPGVVDNG